MENLVSSVLKSKNFSSLDTSSFSARIYERLLSAIVHKELEAGQPLDVENLAKSFGVSRTPVHLAIARLADLGLVEIKPRKGTFVAKLTAQDVHELFEVRGLIEAHAVRKGAESATDNQLTELKQLVEGLQTLFVGDQYIDYHAFLEQDRKFHSMIVTLGKNQRFVLMYNQARILIELTRASASKQMGGAALNHERHLAIVEALMARDGEKAARAVEKHIQESEQAIIGRLHFSSEELQAGLTPDTA
jgi:DNA-binding GntR family transcriptional regulator